MNTNLWRKIFLCAACVCGTLTPMGCGGLPPDSAQFNPASTSLWTETFSGTSLPANWTATGWRVSNGLMSPASGQGFGALATFAQYYAVEQRVMRATFSVANSSAVMGLGSVASSDGSFGNDQSLVTVGNGNLIIKNHGTAGTDNGTLLGVPLGFAMAPGNTYVLTVYVNERELTASITDPVTGIMATAHTGNNATDMGAGNTWGDFDDDLCFDAIAGRFTVSKLEILAMAAKPNVFFTGDSITWGATTEESQRWAHLVGAQLHPNAWIASGRSGGTSAGVLARMTSEAGYLQPHVVVTLIGTNDAAVMSVSQYQSNINAIIAYDVSIGAKPVILTLPPRADGLNSTITTFNAWLKTLTSATLVRADLAMSINNDGITPNPALYSPDGVHPNPAGNAAIAARFSIDAPFIYDAK